MTEDAAVDLVVVERLTPKDVAYEGTSQQGVEFVHRFFVLDPKAKTILGEWVRLARAPVSAMTFRGNLVGGIGSMPPGQTEGDLAAISRGELPATPY